MIVLMLIYQCVTQILFIAAFKFIPGCHLYGIFYECFDLC